MALPMEGPLNVEIPDQLLPYLVEQGELGSGEQCSFCNLSGGVSNRTVRVVRPGRTNLIVKQALSKLRVDIDWYSSPKRVHREFAALQVVASLLPGQVPSACFEDTSQHIIGMEEVPVPHYNWKERMLSGTVEPKHWASFGHMLARIHSATHVGLSDLPNSLRDKSFFETLRLEPYYRYSGQQEPDAAAFLDNLISETRTLAVALVHGDYSPKNILIRDGVLHLLDYEVCHIGDPAFDVGFGLTHALSKAHKLPQRRKKLLESASEFWMAYSTFDFQEFSNSRWEERAVHHALACLLARAIGKSPLEYLSLDQRKWQSRTALNLINNPHARISELIEDFGQRLSEITVPE